MSDELEHLIFMSDELELLIFMSDSCQMSSSQHVAAGTFILDNGGFPRILCSLKKYPL